MEEKTTRASELAAVPERPMTRRTMLQGAGAAGATLLGGSLLAACGGGSSSGSAKVTLEFWDMQWGNEQYEKTARALLAQYHRENPNVTIKYRLVPWPNVYETFSTAIASGTAPDVSTGLPSLGHEFEAAVAPLDALVAEWKKDGTAEDLVPGIVETQRSADGKQIALPWQIEVHVPTYNTRLFKKAGISSPPTNLDELREAAQRLAHIGVAGIGFSGDNPYFPVDIMHTNGGGLYTNSCGPNVLSDRNREAAQFIEDLVRDGSVPKGAAGWVFNDLINALQSGKLGIMLSPPLMFNYVTNSAELDVLPPIEGFHGDTGMMRWNYAFFMFDSCKHQDVASQFMNWWLVNSKPLHEKGGVTSIPIRKSFWDTKLLRDSRSRFVLDEWLPIGKIITAPCPHLLPTTGKLEGPSFMPVFMQDLLNLEPVDASLQKVHDAMAELEA